MRRAVIALLPLLCVLPSLQQAQAKELAALVRDLTPGTQSGSPSTFTSLGNTRFFFANTHGRIDVWRSDGTTLGTVSVSNPPSAHTGQEPGGRGLVVGNALYFVANNLHDLVRLDGTLPLGPAVGGRANFSMGVHGLWSTDGTAPGQVDPGAMGRRVGSSGTCRSPPSSAPRQPSLKPQEPSPRMRACDWTKT